MDRLQLHPADAARLLASADGERPVLLDVREPWELATARLPGSLDIPMGQIPERLDELPPDRPLIVMCHHGMRSLQVVMFLQHRGFESVSNLAGGIDAWSREVDPSIPTY